MVEIDQKISREEEEKRLATATQKFTMITRLIPYIGVMSNGGWKGTVSRFIDRRRQEVCKTFLMENLLAYMPEDVATLDLSLLSNDRRETFIASREAVIPEGGEPKNWGFWEFIGYMTDIEKEISETMVSLKQE